MNYIVFDLEFNQSSKENNDLNCPFEIIHIGAVKLDEKFETISTFNKLIKPEIYTDIHPFVEQLTGIKLNHVLNSKSFREIYEEFLEFISSLHSVLCIWGMNDIKELLKNINYHKLSSNQIPSEYINIQYYASKYLRCPKGTNIGLHNAVKMLDIPINYQFHDALGDALYTSEIFRKIHSEKIVAKQYSSKKTNNRKRNFCKKQKIDTNKLFKQFEKMYNRNMTNEEKSIIKLAYMMGKTNQFLVEKK